MSLPLELFTSPESSPQSVFIHCAPAEPTAVPPAETVYVQMVILTGNWRGGGRLLAVDSKEAQQQVAKLKPLDEKDHQ